jgi:ribonuclease P protein component
MLVAHEAVQDSQSSFPATFVANLTPSHRLLREDGFDRVIQAENIANKYFKIFFLRNNKPSGRLGIISSKRILPRAVDRNRAKRLIREAFRQHKIKASACDVVVMIRPFYAQETSRLSENLASLFSKVENRCTDL